MNNDRLMQVLVSPVVSERAQSRRTVHGSLFSCTSRCLETRDQNLFVMMFDVKVDAVRVVNIKGKHKRFGRLMGQQQSVRFT